MPRAQPAQAIMQVWLRRGWLAILLTPFAIVFGALLALRRLAYRAGWARSQRLPVPVIVIGNLFVGGTGKTPLTIWLLAQLRQAGYQPGVISRGYGADKRQSTTARVVHNDALPGEVGDEPLLIARASGCPVVVGRDRAAAGRLLLANFPAVNVLVADDGLQHLALQRDVEIVLFDGRGVGNGWLLPAGPLREPSRRHRDVTVVNLNPDEQLPAGVPVDAYRMQLQGVDAWQLCAPDQRRSLTSLAAAGKVLAAAGIGNPARFFSMLRLAGIPCETLALPDHFDFRSDPFAVGAARDADLILVTEKDAVKCRQMHTLATDPRIWVVTAEVQVAGDLLAAVRKKLEMRRSGSESPIA